jgi:hypothetical protein
MSPRSKIVSGGFQSGIGLTDDALDATLAANQRSALLVAEQTKSAALRQAAEAGGDASQRATRNALQRAGDAAAAGAKRTAKAAADNAGKLITAGLVVGGGLYLENKFKKADKDTKNCINVCLPENWDDYEYGDLDKSDLKYRVLEGEDANAAQPLCTATMDDCGEYCGPKCEDLHEYDIPGSKTAAGLGKGLGKGLGGLFGGLAKGLGKLFDPSGMASKFSLVMIILIIVMTAIRMMKK